MQKERQKRAFYPDYKAIIHHRYAYATNSNVKRRALEQRYKMIPKEFREQIELEYEQDTQVNFKQVLLLTWFTFLQSGLMQTKVYLPGDPNKPLDLDSIDIASTLDTLVRTTNFVLQICQRIDAGLTHSLPFMLPMAAGKSIGEKTLNQNKVLDVLPEFIHGSTDIPKKQAKQITALAKKIHQLLFKFLREQTKQPKVIVLGENHNSSLFRKIFMLAYLGIYREHQPNAPKISIVQECNADTELAKATTLQDRNAMYEQAFHTSNPKQIIEQGFQLGCFAQNSGKLALQDDISAQLRCSVLQMTALGFDIHYAGSDKAFSKKIQDQINQDRQYLADSYVLSIQDTVIYHPNIEHEPTPLEIKAIEKNIVSTAKLVSEQSTSADIVVVVTGQGHQKPITQALRKAGLPTLSVALVDDKPQTNAYMQGANYLANACILPASGLDPKIQKALQERGATHIVADDSPYNKAHGCDKKLHKFYQNYSGRVSNKGDGIKKLADKNFATHAPEKMTDFFMPKKTVRAIAKKMAEKTKKTAEPSNQHHHVL